MNARNKPKPFAFIRETPRSSLAAKHVQAFRWIARSCASLAVLLAPTMPATAQEELRTVKHSSWVGSVAFDLIDESAIFTACADGRPRKWNYGTGEEVWTLNGHSDVVSSVAINYRYGGALVTGSYDGTVRFIGVGEKVDLLTRAAAQTLGTRRPSIAHRGSVMAVACNLDGVIASGGIDGTVRISGVEAGSKINVLRGHKSWVNSLDFQDQSLNKNKLASGSSDGTVKIWNISPGADQTLQKTLEITSTEVRTVKYSPNGHLLAIGIRYGDIQLWDVTENTKLKSFKAHDGDCWAVKFSPDGKMLITGGGDWGKPGEVKFWDVKTGDLKTTLKHSGEVLCLAVSPDGRRLAAGGGDGNVKVWNTEKLIGVSTIP